ncbi:MAG: polysaccharide biosynthesis tyrosine autokinase [Acidobacteria bacterium]|nr:polysaccharide biosynthesis tyrosine autokinase [Acidobacteriota bacterium]
MADKTGLVKVQKSEEGAFLRPIGLSELATPDSYGYPYVTKPDTQEVGAQVRDLWRKVLKHKLMIALITLIVTAIVTVEVFRDKSVYLATATVEIEKENRTLFRSGDVEIETEDTDYSFQTARAMKSKIRLLQTRPLLEDVAVVLHLDQNSQFLAVTERKGILDAIKSVGNSISARGQKKTTPAASEIPDVQLGENLIRPTAESTRLAPAVDVLQSGLSATPVEDTRMLAISFKHSNPELAAIVANTIAKVFIERSYRGKTDKFEEANTWLSTKTRELKAKVEQAEQALSAYTSQRNIFSDGKGSLVNEKLAALHSQAMQAETKRILSQSLYEEVQKGNLDKLPEAFADPQTIALQAKLGELTTQMAQLRVKLAPEHPKVVELSKQLSAIQKQLEDSSQRLAERLKADYERTAREEQSLKAALNQAKNEASQQNQDNYQFSILQQEVETSKKLYTDFLQKTNQANLQTASQQNKGKMIELIEPALVPALPVGPDRLRTIMIGFLLSLAAGIALALFLEFLNNTIKSVEDVTEHLGLPTLAIVPTLTKKPQPQLQAVDPTSLTPDALITTREKFTPQIGNLMVNNDHSTFAEAYRAIRNSILLASAGTPPRTILLTSSQPGEGKTTTAINTAIALSQLKVRTLLIDADMRRPSLHKAFGAPNGQGLSNYLSGNVDVGDVIQKLPIPNLYLLPCGMIPPDPAELVSSAKMKELLEILSSEFQHIIIDSPPLINVSEPIVLATLVDGVIFVVKGAETKRSIVRRAKQELRNVRARIIGIVINNLDLKTEGYDDYYYQRYHSKYKQEQTELNG